MPFPKTSQEWKEIAMTFFQKWNYPHCLGAMDGKHVVISAPNNSGSLYYNYKHSFSLVLMALVDANYRFIFVDIGAYGKQSDGGIFAASSFGKALCTPASLHVPDDDVIRGAEDLGPMPYVIVADEAFPLQRHIMRPYPGKNTTMEQDAYNYRHCRARRVVENAFGILAQKWRVYHSKIAVKPESVIKIVQATTMLHNMMQQQRQRINNEALQASNNFAVDAEKTACLQPFKHTGNRGTNEAIVTREKFTSYFNTEPLPWQQQHVTRGLGISMGT